MTTTALNAFARSAALIGLAIAGLATPPIAAHAQTYPARPITILVPFPPGAGPDLLARVLSEKLAPKLGEPLVVENRPGAGGLIGAGLVAKAAPDGHTLLLTPSNTIMIAPHLMAKGAGGGVDVLKDFAPIILPATTPTVLAVNPQLGVKSTAELVALARKTPDLAYASSGNGSAMHIAGELFKRSADVNMVHVPYKGAQPAVVAALGGEVRVLYMPLGGIVQHIRSGKLVPLGVAEKSRTGLMPDLPTLGEQGYKGVEVNAWYGVLAPAGTPPAVIARLNQEINAALQAADVRERLSVAGMDVVGGTPATLATEMREGYERYGKIVHDFGIRAD